MAAFNIKGVARVELFGKVDDRDALLVQAFRTFQGIRKGMTEAGIPNPPTRGVIAHNHKTLCTLLWLPNDTIVHKWEDE